ncbi:unnamed protein product [Penicillium roqueforti FM164]|uniref:Genomic scaffold, ProqFM164S01 n=1 Tax=Penicillium roqueforti (strain FM164) TaxID=1365484 RepID=W6QCB6_PENRF|nr:unnamed protein product [Penicillium roqueforti FM164]
MFLSYFSTSFHFTCRDGAELLKVRCYVIGLETCHMSISIKTLWSYFEVTSTKSNEYKSVLASHKRGSHLLCGTE